MPEGVGPREEAKRTIYVNLGIEFDLEKQRKFLEYAVYFSNDQLAHLAKLTGFIVKYKNELKNDPYTEVINTLERAINRSDIHRIRNTEMLKFFFLESKYFKTPGGREKMEELRKSPDFMLPGKQTDESSPIQKEAHIRNRKKILQTLGIMEEAQSSELYLLGFFTDEQILSLNDILKFRQQKLSHLENCNSLLKDELIETLSLATADQTLDHKRANMQELYTVYSNKAHKKYWGETDPHHALALDPHYPPSIIVSKVGDAVITIYENRNGSLVGEVDLLKPTTDDKPFKEILDKQKIGKVSTVNNQQFIFPIPFSVNLPQFLKNLIAQLKEVLSQQKATLKSAAKESTSTSYVPPTTVALIEIQNAVEKSSTEVGVQMDIEAQIFKELIMHDSFDASEAESHIAYFIEHKSNNKFMPFLLRELQSLTCLSESTKQAVATAFSQQVGNKAYQELIELQNALKKAIPKGTRPDAVAQDFLQLIDKSWNLKEAEDAIVEFIGYHRDNVLMPNFLEAMKPLPFLLNSKNEKVKSAISTPVPPASPGPEPEDEKNDAFQPPF